MKSSCDSNPIKFQNPEIEKLTNTAKKRFFNADNNNVPEKDEYYLEQKKLKFHRKFQDNEFERDQQYEGLHVTIDEIFDPTKHITTTYLWTNSSGRLLEPKITTTETSWFESLDVPSQYSAVSACVGSSSRDLVLDGREKCKI